MTTAVLQVEGLHKSFGGVQRWPTCRSPSTPASCWR